MTANPSALAGESLSRRPGFGGVRSWKATALGLLLAAVSAVFIWLLGAQGVGLWLHGVTTDATVVASEPWRGRVSPGFIQVGFTDVHGVHHVVYLNDGPGHDFPKAGSSLRVLYDSSNPSNAQSASDPGPWGWWLLSLPILPLGVWIAWCGWRGRLPDVFDTEYNPLAKLNTS